MNTQCPGRQRRRRGSNPRGEKHAKTYIYLWSISIYHGKGLERILVNTGPHVFPSLRPSAPPRLPAGITGSAIWRIGMKKKVSWLFYMGSPVIGFTLGAACGAGAVY